MVNIASIRPHGSSNFNYEETIMLSKRQVKRLPVYLDALAVKVSRLALEGGLPPRRVVGQLRSEGEDIRGERDVRRMIARARAPDRPLVIVRVEQVDTGVAIDRELGGELRTLAGVRQALVVKTSLRSDDHYCSHDPDLQGRAYRESDDLHWYLSRAAARYLWGHLRDGDCIALGGGRATGFTVRALKDFARYEPKSFVGLRILSLTGGMIVWPWSEKRGNLDADAVAVELGGILQVPQKQISLVHLPVSLEPAQREVIRTAAPHLWVDPWERPPDIALFGLGVLNTGHHLLQYSGPHTQAFQVELDALKGKVLPRALSAVADICHRFFWIGGADVPKDVRRAAEEIVEGLNGKTVSVTFPHLNEAREKILVAGGAQKYQGILALFTRCEEIGLKPTILVTDEVTARRLLEDIPRARS
jgi:DNA-binding transcriptional regulator LsrR (DeoR family)